MTVYKSPTCGCCAKWVDHLKAAGFTTVVHDEEDMDTVKDSWACPRTCGPATPRRWTSI